MTPASPSPSPSPSPSIAPSPTTTLPSTIGWTDYTSKQYGYQIAYPPTWVADVHAKRAWVLATDRLRSPSDGMNGSADHFIGDWSGGSTAVTGWQRMSRPACPKTRVPTARRLAYYA